MNLVFDGFGRDERIEEDRSTWFTPPDIARRMVAWAGSMSPVWILEPSAGSGNLVAACRDRWASTRIEALEIDPYYVDVMRSRFRGDERVLVRGHGSFMEPWYERSSERFDFCIMNPPYEDGLDGKFLARAMDLSDRVIALVRLAALVGQARTEAVWSRCRPDGDFALRGLALFAGRPRFESGRAVGDREDSGSAKADFCVVKLSRRAEHERGIETQTSVEWW